ncbi:hypothetical protein B566_EDAN007837 [Ephemera danica]|nr:hypothetical protein B566_EDAN007837 [Ephemera danica]
MGVWHSLLLCCTLVLLHNVTLTYTVPGDPQNVSAEPINSTSVMVRWKPPLDKDRHGVIRGYHVHVQEAREDGKPSGSDIAPMRFDVLGGQNPEFNVTGLQPDTKYSVQVAALTRKGDGDRSNPVLVKTLGGVPNRPALNLTVLDEGLGLAVELTWAEPTQVYGEVKGYRLIYSIKELDIREEILMTDHVHSHTIQDLERGVDYEFRVSALNNVDYGQESIRHFRTPEGIPTGPPVNLKPGSAPWNIQARPLSSSTMVIQWDEPQTPNGQIMGYKVYYTTDSNLPMASWLFQVVDNNKLTTISDLIPHTMYTIRVQGFTSVGPGPLSMPVLVKTQQGVPGQPNDLKAVDITETSVLLQWQRPIASGENIVSYELYWNDTYSPKEKYHRRLPLTESHRLTNLFPNSLYYVWLAARSQRGEGATTSPLAVRTKQYVPGAPPQDVKAVAEGSRAIRVSWKPPPERQQNGELEYFKVQLVRSSQSDSEASVVLVNGNSSSIVLDKLAQWTEYRVWVLAGTQVGDGPSSFPITTPDIVSLTWSPPPRSERNGQVTHYDVQFHKVADHAPMHERNVSTTKAVFGDLEENATYLFRVRAHTSKGAGPFSEQASLSTEREVLRAPLALHAVATSESSVEVWWEAVPNRGKVLGYQVFYTMTAVEDLDKWQQKVVGLTESVELSNLEKFSQYAIAVAARTKQIALEATKQFVDAQGITQTAVVPKRTIMLDYNTLNHLVGDLSPFTTYSVNVSAVPSDLTYRPPARITYGPISHYYLIVVPEDKSTAHKYPDAFLIDEMLASKGQKQERENAPYIAAKFPQRNIPYTYPLGSGQTQDGFTNRRLQKGKKYRIFVRAVVDTPQKHLYTSSPFSEPLSLDMREVPPGEPPRRPSPELPVESSDGVAVNPSHAEVCVLCIAVPVIAALVLGLIVMSVVVRRRRRPCKSPEQALVLMPLMASPEAVGSLPVAPSDPVEMRRLKFQTPAMMSHPPIHMVDLSAHIDSLKANDNLKFSQEYESIEPGQQFTWDHSNLDVNRNKNRYANVIAYDHSRVILTPLENVAGSDYINANYCDGFRKQNAYIATQGPLQETLADFWRMVWEMRACSVVMMTKLEERARIKCDQYWPSRGSETYGAVTVTISDVQELATYCIRTFHLTKSGLHERREVRQFQFTAWPDHGVPDHPAPFLLFLRRVRIMTPSDSGPMVVHCSAGVGRTGCFIVIDSMLERMRCDKMIDIYGHVTCLRAQRNYMVQTEDQYIFIHDALLEAAMCGNTEVPARNLHQHLEALLQSEPGESATGMELEFKKLSSIRVDANRFVSAAMPCNKAKNRLVHILPFEATRVSLQPIRGMDGSDYINASYVDGYRYRNAYIATQGPLPETTEDLWRMLWEHNSTIIVMLTKLKEMGRDKCQQYWPSDRSVRYSYFVVDPIAEYNMPQYVLREFKVTDARDGQSRTVRQFQFMDWPEQGVPKSGEGFIDFIGQVHKTKEQFGQDGPITVHCSAGVGRTGVFIALSIVLERMQYEGVVDVFQTVRIMRTQRPAMVQTEEQYQFCYRAALEYLGSFDHYAT